MSGRRRPGNRKPPSPPERRSCCRVLALRLVSNASSPGSRRDRSSHGAGALRRSRTAPTACAAARCASSTPDSKTWPCCSSVRRQSASAPAWPRASSGRCARHRLRLAPPRRCRPATSAARAGRAGRGPSVRRRARRAAAPDREPLGREAAHPGPALEERGVGARRGARGCARAGGGHDA